MHRYKEGKLSNGSSYCQPGTDPTDQIPDFLKYFFHKMKPSGAAYPKCNGTRSPRALRSNQYGERTYIEEFYCNEFYWCHL